MDGTTTGVTVIHSDFVPQLTRVHTAEALCMIP